MTTNRARATACAAAALALVAPALGVVPGPGVGPASASASTDTTFAQLWMTAGHTFEFATVLDAADLDFEVVVHSANSTTVVIDWVVTYNGTEYYQQARYDRDTRENLDRPGSYAVTWINGAQVDAGQAWIDDRVMTLTESTLTTYVFENGSLRFVYDSSTGTLVQAEDTSRSSVMDRLSSGPGTVPEGDPDTSGTITVREPESRTMVMAMSTDDSTTDNDIRLTCTRTLSQVLGGAYDPCVVQYDYDIDAGSIELDKPNVQWPAYSDGHLEIEWNDPEWPHLYKYEVCDAPDPIVTAEQDPCEARDHNDDFPEGGTHEWVVTGEFEHCLSAHLALDCQMEVTADIHGAVTCISGPPACEPI